MQMVQVIIITLVFTTNIVSQDNNVCLTYPDYYTIDTNSKCWFDVAADPYSILHIITTNGYPYEIHRVQTADNYILTMFRIPNDRLDIRLRKKPVLLQHGFLLSGASFLGLGNISLALLLAADGYDVWIGNFRGSDYSVEHATLNRHDFKFWDFNSDDLGLKDIPAKLKYISQETGNAGNIIYIGHSLGTTAALMYASRFPQDVIHMVKLFIFMSPNGGMRNTKSIFFRIAPLFMNIVVALFMNTEVVKTLAPGGFSKDIKSFCKSNPLIMEACIHALNAFNMGPQVQTDASVAPIIFNQFPGGSSIKVYKQIGDQTQDYDFSAYDYGLQNTFIYGQPRPPIYNVSRIDVPIYLIFSKGDWCTTSEDAEILYNRLSANARIYGKYVILKEYFNHNDFIYSKDAKNVIYDRILNLMNSVT